MEKLIRTGYGRPRKLGIIRQTTISLYEAYGDLYEKSSELARREGLSFSELVSKALYEYLEEHYPGQPTPPLESFDINGLKAVRLEARFLAKNITNLLEKLNSNSASSSYKKRIRTRELPKKLVRLARLDRRLRGEYNDIIDQGEAALDG